MSDNKNVNQDKGLQGNEKIEQAIAALQQETQPPLAANVHGEGKDRVAKLLFSAQLIVEPRLYDLPQQRAIG